MGMLDYFDTTGDMGGTDVPMGGGGLLDAFHNWVQNPRNSAQLLGLGASLLTKRKTGTDWGAAINDFQNAGQAYDQQNMQKQMQKAQLGKVLEESKRMQMGNSLAFGNGNSPAANPQMPNGGTTQPNADGGNFNVASLPNDLKLAWIDAVAKQDSGAQLAIRKYVQDGIETCPSL